MTGLRLEYPTLYDAAIHYDGCKTINSLGESITVTTTSDLHYFMDTVGHQHKYVIYKEVPESTGMFQTGDK